MRFQSGQKQQSLLKGLSYSMVFQVIGKALGYIRYLLIAYYFGVSRGLDLYYVAYGMVLSTVFSITGLFDQILVPRLIQLKHQESDLSFSKLCGSFFSLSWVVSFFLLGLFYFLLPFIELIFAHGFSSVDRIELRRLTNYFIPWIIMSLPLGTLLAVFKCVRQFHVVFITDLIISLSATVGLIVWHSSPQSLAMVMSLGTL